MVISRCFQLALSCARQVGFPSAIGIHAKNKQFLVEQLTERLRETVAIAKRATQAASDEARDGASPAEKREDARVHLEYSSLAGGQAERAARAAAELSVL